MPQPTLPDLLVQIRNLSYFFVGFVVIWVFVLGFAYMVLQRGRNLRAEIDELKNTIDTTEPK